MWTDCFNFSATANVFWLRRFPLLPTITSKSERAELSIYDGGDVCHWLNKKVYLTHSLTHQLGRWVDAMYAQFFLFRRNIFCRVFFSWILLILKVIKVPFSFSVHCLRFHTSVMLQWFKTFLNWRKHCRFPNSLTRPLEFTLGRA